MTDEVTLKPVSGNPFDRRPPDFPVESPAEGQAAAARSLEILKKEQAERPDDPALKREITRTEKLAGQPAAPGAQPAPNRGTSIAGELKLKKTAKPLFPETAKSAPTVELKPVDGDPFAADSGTTTADYLKSGAAGVLSGTGMIAQGGGELLARGINLIGDRLGFDPALRAENPLQGWVNDLMDSRTPAAKKAEANTQITGELLKPSTWSAGNDPSVAGIALQGMNAIGQFAPNLGIALVTAGASLPVQLGVGAVVGGLQALGGGAGEERHAISAMKHEDLMAGSQLYAELVKRGVPQGQAKDAVAEAAALGGGIGNAIPSAAEGAFENFLIGALTRGKIKIPALGAGRLGQAASGAIGGGAMGGAEEAIEQVGQNIGSNVAIGGERPLGAETLQQFVMGMIAEGAAGGGAGVLAKPQPAAQAAPQEPVAPGPSAQPVAAPEAPAAPLTAMDQARVDAQVLKSGGDLPEADEVRLKNATLLSVYGENAAVRHVIESPQQFASIGDAMLLAAPTVERVRGTIAQNEQARDITPDIVGAIDELQKIRAEGKTLAQVVAQGIGHDVSFEAQQLMQFLDANADNPKRIASFLENYLQEVENATGVPSEVRGRAFQILEEQSLARKKVEEEKAAAQVAEKDQAEQDTLKKVKNEVARIKAELALKEIKAKAAKPEGQTAMEAAFEKAKTLKGTQRAKPGAEADRAIPLGAAKHPAPREKPHARPATVDAGAVPESREAPQAGEPRSVRKEGNQERASEKPSAKSILGNPAHPLFDSYVEWVSSVNVKTRAIEAETGRHITVSERADVALKDINHQIKTMEALLQCLG